MNISTALQCFLALPACWGGQCFSFSSSPHASNASRFELSRGAWPLPGPCGCWGQQLPHAWWPASNILRGEHEANTSPLLLLLQPHQAQGYPAGIVFCCPFHSTRKKRCYDLTGRQSCPLQWLHVQNTALMPSLVLTKAKSRWRMIPPNTAQEHQVNQREKPV